MKITAIIQARMTSTRLPGKILMKIMGRPMLSYQIERIRFSKWIDDFIIATTVNKEDDPIVALSQKEDLPFYRGSEHDVLDRYYQAAKEYSVNHIMRLTADCPLIDPSVMDKTVEEYKINNPDYIYTGPNFAEGLDCEIFSYKALEIAWREATIPLHREHVTLFFRENQDLFKCHIFDKEKNDGKYRITVDEKEDFSVVKSIIEDLYSSEDPIFYFERIKEFLDDHPEVYTLNFKIPRNEGRKNQMN